MTIADQLREMTDPLTGVARGVDRRTRSNRQHDNKKLISISVGEIRKIDRTLRLALAEIERLTGA